jgi:hypothetical protein
MKNVLLYFILSLNLVALYVFSQNAPGPFLDNANPQRIKVDPAKRYARTGGMITQRSSDPRILFVNCCDPSYADNMQRIQQELEKITALPCAVETIHPKNDDVCALAAQLLAKPENAVVIILGSSDKYPSLLTAPENQWGFFNLNFLKSDGCDAKTLKDRIVKQGWRTLSATLGSIYTTSPVCLMKPITKAEQLDAFNLFVISPEPLSKLQNQAKIIGLKTMKRTTYSIAVKEGWAPAPTNDVQRAIWQRHGKTPPK